jgi:hypothetical protein
MGDDLEGSTRFVEGLPRGIGLSLFSWGPGDSLVLVHSTKTSPEHALVAAPQDVLELRLRSPWELWRWMQFAVLVLQNRMGNIEFCV